MNLAILDVSTLKALQLGVQKAVRTEGGNADVRFTAEEAEAFQQLLKSIDFALEAAPSSDSNLASLDKKMDRIISMLQAAPTSDSGPGRDTNQIPSCQRYLGQGPHGEEVGRRELMAEGGELGDEKDTERARRAVGDSVDPSPEPEGSTRLRKMVIRIQTQNHITHGMLAASLLFSIVWNFGTFAFVNSIQSNITRPFDVVGNTFNSIFRRGRGKDFVPIDIPFEDLRLGDALKFGSENESDKAENENKEGGAEKGGEGEKKSGRNFLSKIVGR